MDGTLLDPCGQIHPKDIRLLSNVSLAPRLIPATGRPLESVRRTFARNGLYIDEKLPFALVLQNGSLLYAANEARLAYYPFDPSVQVELIQLARQFKHVMFLFLGSNDIHVLWPNSFGMKAAEKFEFTVQAFSTHSNKSQFSKIMCISPFPNLLDRLAKPLKSLPVESAFSMSTILEITPKEVNKGSGLQKLLHMLQQVTGTIYAAGDGENDLPMFQLARRSFAPDQASETVKRIASQVINVRLNGLLEPILDSIAQDPSSESFIGID
jgi:Cof subfamily protein (haloacid dehalogenase superfamily)